MDRTKRKFVPKRNFIQRYPRAFQTVFITVGLLIFFSKPIYDGFIRDDYLPAPPPAIKSKN